MHGGRGTSTETVRAVLADNQNDVVLSVGALLACDVPFAQTFQASLHEARA